MWFKQYIYLHPYLTFLSPVYLGRKGDVHCAARVLIKRLRVWTRVEGGWDTLFFPSKILFDIYLILCLSQENIYLKMSLLFLVTLQFRHNVFTLMQSVQSQPASH